MGMGTGHIYLLYLIRTPNEIVERILSVEEGLNELNYPSAVGLLTNPGYQGKTANLGLAKAEHELAS